MAAVQFAATHDVAVNLATLTDLVKRAASEGAELVVAPEAAMHDFGDKGASYVAVAERLDGRYVEGVGDVARREGVTVVAGMFESTESDDVRVYNTVIAVGPDGRLVGHYRKQHLFDALGWQESLSLSPGEPDRRLVFDCGGLRVGVMTCYDLRFPELARALVDDGATALVVPAAWVAGPHKIEQWQTLIAARAIENVCFTIGAAQSGGNYCGNSLVVDPFGVVLAQAAEGHLTLDAPQVVVADLDPDRITDCRELMPSLANRRWSVSPVSPKRAISTSQQGAGG